MSNAKNIARQRIESLFDANSFVEIGASITARSTDFNLGKVDAPSDGVITGYGLIEGKLVYVYSQDPEVLNGSIGEMHAKKIVRIIADAVKMGAPVIGCIDCSGIRLEEATDALNGFGEIYAAKAKASGVVLQMDIIFGNCGGGMAVASSLSDFTFMSTEGKFYVTSPDAVDDNKSEKCDTSAACYVGEMTDAIDMIASEAEIIAEARKLVAILPGNNEDEAVSDCVDDLNRKCDGINLFGKDKLSVIKTIADGNLFVEVKANYCKSMITGFMLVNGATVGVVANAYSSDDKKNIVLCPMAAKKAASFIGFCDAFEIPLLTLAEINGYATSKKAEAKMAKAAAALTAAYAEATVPKVTFIVGDVYGSAAMMMNSKATGADMVYAWPELGFGMMDPKSAVKIIYAEDINASDDKIKFIDEKNAEYKKAFSSVESAAARGYVDMIVDPAETRKYVISAFEMLYSKRADISFKKHSTIK